MRIFRLYKEITQVPIFFSPVKEFERPILVFCVEPSLGIRDSHVIKLMRNYWKEWISLLICEPSLIAVIFIFLVLFFLLLLFFHLIWSWYQFYLAYLRLLITFSGAVRKMFRMHVIFGGTMDNYISMERLQNVESKYIKILEIYRFG